MALRGLLALLVFGLLAAGAYIYQTHSDFSLPVAGGDSDSQADSRVFNASEFFLDNGLQIVVIPNHRAPVVTHMVWYKVGAADEMPGKSGIAHFLEHLLFKGSDVIGEDTPLPPGEFSKIIRGIGGRDNAFTSQDYTAYFQSIPRDALERVMRMEAGRMRGAAFPVEEVEAENKVILEERRQRTDNDPRAQFGEQLAAAAFVNHPYGTPVIGWYHEMQTLGWDDAKGFYDRWYGPNNAILIVSGDVEPQEVYDLAAAIYGQVPAQDIPARMRPQSPPFPGQSRLTLTHEIVREPVIQILHRAPSFRQDADHGLALQVLEQIMGGGSSARLYRSLVSEQKIAVGAGMSYRGDAIDDGQIWIYANPVPGEDLETVEVALYAELRRLIADGVTDAELRDAKTTLQDAAIYARDSLSGPAMIIGRALSTGSTLEEVETWPAAIEAVTADQVVEAARRYLNPDAPGDHAPVVGVMMPKTQEVGDE